MIFEGVDRTATGGSWWCAFTETMPGRSGEGVSGHPKDSGRGPETRPRDVCHRGMRWSIERLSPTLWTSQQN